VVESLVANWPAPGHVLRFFGEHWKHRRTTNVIESPFATVRLRERATRGAGLRTKGFADGLQATRHGPAALRLDGAQLLPLVRAGVRFIDRVQGDRAKNVTQSTDNEPSEAADHFQPIHNL